MPITPEFIREEIARGAGTLSGPIVGAALVVLLKNVASAYIDRWVMLLGFVFIFIVMFVPGGIVAGVMRLWQSLDFMPSAGRTKAAVPVRTHQTEEVS